MNHDYISLTSLPHSLNLTTLVWRLRRARVTLYNSVDFPSKIHTLESARKKGKL
jgi:hypothetical protein